jgi:hypothetical protein
VVVVVVDEKRLVGAHVEDRDDGLAGYRVGLANGGYAVEVATASPERMDASVAGRTSHFQLGFGA